MKKSESIVELAKALVELQGEMPVVQMDSSNPFFNNAKYASLGALIQTSKPILHKHGFSVLQPQTSFVEGGVTYVGVNTILLHVSGEWIEDAVFLPINDKQDESEDKKKKSPNHPQKAGIVITYLRRYGWAGILGLYAEQDTDGNIGKLESDDIDALIKARKELSATFASRPELQEKFKEALKSLGYNNDSTDLKLIEKANKQLKGIIGE